MDRIRMYDPNFKPIKDIATAGRSDGEVQCPHGIVVDKSGFIVIADGANHRFQIFSPEGKFLRRIYSKYNMRCPPAVAITKDGDIVVIDSSAENRIQIFGS